MDLLPVTLCGFYRLKPMKRVYLDPDAHLEMVVHKPVGHSLLATLDDEAVLRRAARHGKHLPFVEFAPEISGTFHFQVLRLGQSTGWFG